MQNKKSPLVSVIMNCHNGEEYLEKSLKSLLNQSYKKWELIFFDNCSQDKSIKIIKNFFDNRIKIFSSKKKLTLYRARNLAIKQARGKYISFLDVDDMWEKEKIESQISFLKKNREFTIVYSNYYVLKEKMKKKYIKFKKELKSGFITQDLLNEYSIGILTVFFDSKIIKKDFFDKRYNIIGDFDCFLKLSLKYKIAYLNKPLASYRIHDKNYSMKNLNEYVDELKIWMKNNARFFSNFSFLNLNIYLIKLRIKVLLKYCMGV